eukprot:280457_1
MSKPTTDTASQTTQKYPIVIVGHNGVGYFWRGNRGYSELKEFIIEKFQIDEEFVVVYDRCNDCRMAIESDRDLNAALNSNHAVLRFNVVLKLKEACVTDDYYSLWNLLHYAANSICSSLADK